MPKQSTEEMIKNQDSKQDSKQDATKKPQPQSQKGAKENTTTGITSLEPIVSSIFQQVKADARRPSLTLATLPVLLHHLMEAVEQIRALENESKLDVVLQVLHLLVNANVELPAVEIELLNKAIDVMVPSMATVICNARKGLVAVNREYLAADEETLLVVFLSAMVATTTFASNASNTSNASNKTVDQLDRGITAFFEST